MTRESKIEEYAALRVKAAGGQIRKVKWIGRKGAPDRRIMLPGKCMWVEFKAPGVKIEDHQEREHRRMREMGEDVRVVDSFQGVDKLFT